VVQDGSHDLSAPPPFGLSDIRDAIPKQCWEKNAFKSLGYLALDVAVVTGLAAGAYAINQWWAWPLYWFAQV
jgi:omega-3 fatty acid desaturase (delta-15 desaturase)